jgi:hypothetical protein
VHRQFNARAKSLKCSGLELKLKQTARLYHRASPGFMDPFIHHHKWLEGQLDEPTFHHQPDFFAVLSVRCSSMIFSASGSAIKGLALDGTAVPADKELAAARTLIAT